MNARRAAVACAAMSILIVSGCADGQPASPNSSGAAKPTAASTSSPGSGTGATTLGLVDGTGAAYEAGRHLTVDDATDGPPGLTPVFSYPTRSGGEYTSMFALAADGTVLAPRGQDAMTGAAAGDADFVLYQSSLGLLGSDGTFAPYPQASTDSPDDAPRQAVVGAYADGVAAWLETPSTDISIWPWRLCVNDGTDTRLVAETGSDLDSVRVSPRPWPQPAIGHGHVYFDYEHATGDPDDDGLRAMSLDVMAAPVDGSADPVVVARNAVLPVITDDGVAYVRTPGYDGDMAAGTYAIFESVDGDESTLVSGTLTEGQGVGGLAAVPGHLVWTVSTVGDASGGVMYVLDRATGVVDTVDLAAAVSALSASGTYVAWGSGSGEADADAGEYLLDVTDLSMWRLGELSVNSSAFVGGSYVAWSSDDGTGQHQYTVARLPVS